MRARVSEDFEARLAPALRPGTDRSAHPAGEDRADDLVALAVDLRDAARPLAGVLPRQEFRVALAERLADQARELEPERRAAATGTGAPARRANPVRTHQPRGSEHRRRLRTVTAGLVAVVVAGGAGAAVASESALPGSLLYPLKRQVEDLRLTLSSPGQARGGTELSLARKRLLEAEELALASGGADVLADTPRLRATLDDFAASALAGIASLNDDYAETGDAASLAAINTFLDETVRPLERLRTMTPPSVHAVIDQLLADLEARRAELADTVASCAACRDIDLVVAVPQTEPTEGSSVGPDGPATAVPSTTPVESGEGGTGGGPLDPLDPVVDPLPLDPVESSVDGLPPAPDPTSTPPLPLPTEVPSVSVPPETGPGVTPPPVTPPLTPPPVTPPVTPPSVTVPPVLPPP